MQGLRKNCERKVIIYVVQKVLFKYVSKPTSQTTPTP